MRLEVKAKVGGRELPIFGEKRNRTSRKPADVANFRVAGICNAISGNVVAVEQSRYVNLCMQSSHGNCGRFRNSTRARGRLRVVR